MKKTVTVQFLLLAIVLASLLRFNRSILINYRMISAITNYQNTSKIIQTHSYDDSLLELRSLDTLIKKEHLENGDISVDTEWVIPNCTSQVTPIDARLIMQNYYNALASHLHGVQDMETLLSCETAYPSSMFLWLKSREYKKDGNIKLAQAHLQMSYILDSHWHKNNFRIQSAIAQANNYLNDGSFTKAQVAYERAIVAYTDDDPLATPAYLQQAYTGLAKVALAQDNDEGILYALRKTASNSRLKKEDVLTIFILHLLANGYHANQIAQTLVQAQIPVDSETAFIIVKLLVQQKQFTDAANFSQLYSSEVGTYQLANQGLALFAQGDTAIATTYLEQAITDLLPQDTFQAIELMLILSKIYEDEGNLTKAIAIQEWAAYSDTGRKWSWYNLARLHQQSGDRIAATTSLQNALIMDPTNETFNALAVELSNGN